VEIGSGRCEFINASTAQTRYAIDIWPEMPLHAEKGVSTHVGSATKLFFLDRDSVDAVFASNVVEHLTREQFEQVLDESWRVLRKGGKLVLLQPNFRYAFRRYFDDYTHVSIWTHLSLSDYLESRGWTLDDVQGRFLPLTVESPLPVSRFLIWLYLRSPIKPLAGQMLLVASKRE
jgi:ubiquinone/menaquinone biosynthesis C-methylase UbiE